MLRLTGSMTLLLDLSADHLRPACKRQGAVNNRKLPLGHTTLVW